MIECETCYENEIEIDDNQNLDMSSVEKDMPCSEEINKVENSIFTHEENEGDTKNRSDLKPRDDIDKEELIVGENMDEIFNKMFVKNMIKTCVSKLDKEYERNSCRKVASEENLTDAALNKDLKENTDGLISLDKVPNDTTNLPVNNNFSWYECGYDLMV